MQQIACKKDLLVPKLGKITRRAVLPGFSLVEIMIVLVIISIIGGVVLPNLMSKPDKARVQATRVEMSSLASALSMYRLEKGKYPTTAEGLSVLTVGPDAAYREVPKDPFGSPYQYIQRTDGFTIVSYGADGMPGGDGFDEDIIFDSQ